MYRKLWLLLIMVLLFTFIGCKDELNYLSSLGSYNLPSQVSLDLIDNCSPYHEIYNISGGKNMNLKLFTVLLDRTKYVHMDDIFREYLTVTKDFFLGHNTYTLKVQFNKNVEPSNSSEYLVKVVNSQGEEIPTTIIKKNIRGESIKGFDTRDPNAGSPSLSGDCLFSFIDPASKAEFLVETDYNIKCIPATLDDQGSILARGGVDYSTKASIGNRYYLKGTSNLNSQSPIVISVYDWNLDGIFNDNALIKIDANKDHFSFPFNKKIALGTGENLKIYMLDLKQENTDGKYILNINNWTKPFEGQATVTPSPDDNKVINTLKDEIPPEVVFPEILISNLNDFQQAQIDSEKAYDVLYSEINNRKIGNQISAEQLEDFKSTVYQKLDPVEPIETCAKVTNGCYLLISLYLGQNFSGVGTFEFFDPSASLICKFEVKQASGTSNDAVVKMLLQKGIHKLADELQKTKPDFIKN